MSKNEKVSKRTLWSIILLSFAGELAWAVENQYFNVFIYQEIAPQPLYVSLMVAVTAAVSTFTTILMGTLSDTKGKRRIFLLFGYVFWTITTGIFPLAGYLQPIWLAVTIAILFDSIMSFFGATANDATLNAYVTDVTTLKNRGAVGAVKEIMFLLAILVVYGFAGVIIEVVGFYNFFYIIALVVGVVGIPGALITPEPQGLRPSELSYWENLKTTYTKKSLTKNKNFFKILISTGIWGVAFNVFFPFVLIYLDTDLNIDIALASILIAIALLVAIIGAYPIGKIVDKAGRKKIAILSIILESIGLFFFAITENIIIISISSTLWVFAMLCYNISSRTWLKDLYPEEKRGQFHGFYLFFNVLIGMTIGPFIGGIIAQSFGKYYVNDYGVPGFTPSMWVFMIAAILILLAIIPLIRAKEYQGE
ncbi:MAG: MFS transporter [Candidatus Lokiarchaeota archaeon]|nr:MFS transporter [Candidatus Lokiarchaeota archaeon]MBD3201844.1 MFS transporter [Candidatus Lokiarchaeota archaeon]